MQYFGKTWEDCVLDSVGQSASCWILQVYNGSKPDNLVVRECDKDL